MERELAVQLGRRFIERRDVKAVQHKDGHYEPDVVHEGHRSGPCTEACARRGFKVGDLIAHVNGEHSFGHYLISPEGECRLFAFDIDLNKDGWYVDLSTEEGDGEPVDCRPREAWLEKGHQARPFLTIQLRALADALGQRVRQLGVPCAVAYSGSKGLHVYGWTGTTPAASARKAALAVLKSFKNPDGSPGFEAVRGENFFESTVEGKRNLSIEVYPKQDSLEGKDLGNLMRLPLGVNRKSGHPAFFVDMTRPLHQLKPVDPLAVLENGQEW